MSNTYTQARTQALSLSTQLSNALATYASFATNDGMSSTSTSASNETTSVAISNSKNKIESLLSELSSSISALQRLVDANGTPSKQQQLARHRDELRRHRTDFQRLSSQIESQRQRANLMQDVREDIAAANASANNEEDYMMDERRRVEQSHSVVDGLISQVLSTRDEMFRQRGVLDNAAGSLERSLSTVPGINTLLAKIDARHRRQAIILTIVVTFCMVILWFSL